MGISERQDNEIAQEIQDQLVRQAEQQRQQEEKDAAIARKMHEKEMKEERRRQKHLEVNLEEEYFEDHGGSGAIVAETEYGVNEATTGLTKLDLREQELKDLEVARRMQEEELKASKMHERASAQVAQDEEIARLLMEREKREYRKIREREHEREREKEKERERDRMERRRQEGDYRSQAEEIVRPRTRDEYEYQRQKNHNKPTRPPQPRVPDYENVNSGYGHWEHPAPPRVPTRSEAAHKGAYYKR